MNISWIVTPKYSTLVDMKEIGPVWGSDLAWRTLNAYNVVCFNYRTISELLSRNFQENCNFYIPEKYYGDLGRPSGVTLVGGEFSEDINYKEEFVCAHLVSGISDLILLGGFDFSVDLDFFDDYEKHRQKNFIRGFRRLISEKTSVQWVLLDHTGEVPDDIISLPNFTQDSTESVVSLLS